MRTLSAYLPSRPQGRCVVVGAGKASARMAEAVEQAWGPCEGLVITRYGYGRPLKSIEIVEAAHPVPDENGLKATIRLLDLVAGLGEDDFCLCLISGGASALLTAPIKGISFAEKQAVNEALLVSGAPINEMNIVRKHLSRIKGGQLGAAAWPARMRCLMISDVPGDDPALIGSGPTVGDMSKPADVLAILDRYTIHVPAHVRDALCHHTGVVRPDDEKLSKVENLVYAAPLQSLQAAAHLAREAGCQVHIIGDAYEGEARDAAQQHLQILLNKLTQRQQRQQDNKPLLLLSGGELTVTMRGKGVGGPNAEFMLALALELASYDEVKDKVHALACDTDGMDGAAEVAGAMIGPDTLELARQAGIDAHTCLANNDAHSFFAAINRQIVSGPTLTNVNDFRAIWMP